MISALLLCAGESRRMGMPKALLNLDGESLLLRSLKRLTSANVDEVLCVTGGHHLLIEQELEKSKPLKPLRVLHNPRFSEGIMGSIQTGLRGLNRKSKAAIITLVDLPFVESEDY